MVSLFLSFAWEWGNTGVMLDLPTMQLCELSLTILYGEHAARNKLMAFAQMQFLKPLSHLHFALSLHL